MKFLWDVHDVALRARVMSFHELTIEDHNDYMYEKIPNHRS
jgi:hypothetical protein